MKQTYFTIVILILFSLSANSQNVNFPGHEELNKLKKELSISHRTSGNESENVFNKSSFDDFKTAQNDFGTTPHWDWTKTFGGSGKDIVREMIVNEDGSMIVAGSFSGDISIASNNYSSIGRRDAFLAKFQSNGTLIWFEQFSPSADNKIDIYGLSVDETGNLYFTGYYTGDVSFGDFDLSDNNEMNLFVASAGSDGQITMATEHSTTNPKETGIKVDTDINGNIYVLSSTDGTTYRTHPSAIIKYSAGGNMIYDYFHDQNFSDMQVFGEHIYFTGTINSDDNIGDNYFEPARWSAFIAQSNLEMEFNWSYMIETEDSYAESIGTGLFVSSNEEVFFVGYSNSNSDITLGSLSTNLRGGYITKVLPSAEVLWMWKILDISVDTPTDVTASENHIFVSSYVDGFYVVTKWHTSTGAYINWLVSDYKTECLVYNPISDNLIFSQDMDQQINLSYISPNNMEEELNVPFGGNSAQTHGIGMGIDQNGFIYNYGYTSNQINHSGQIIDKGLFLAKQDDTGSTLWAKQFENTEDNSNLPGNYITVDTITNSVYITGTFYPYMVIPDGPTLVSGDRTNMFILKYDYNGVFQWAIQEELNPTYLSLATDNSGNLLICGPFAGTIDIGDTTLTSVDMEKEVFIAKYDNSGQSLWAKSISGGYPYGGGLISTDSQDNILLTGEFYAEDFYIDDKHIVANEGDGNILVAKFNPQGTAIWAGMKGNSLVQWGDYYGWPSGIINDAEGNIYLKGWHADSTYFDDIMLISQIDKPGYNNKYNKFVAKIDTEGNTIWAKSISEITSSSDYNQFDIDNKGNVYTGYMVRDTSVFGEDYTYINSGANDLLIVKYSNEGNLDWVKSIKGSEVGNALITSVLVNKSDEAYVYGWFNYFLNFGSSSVIANNKNSFIGLLGEVNGVGENQYNNSDLFSLFPNPAINNTTLQLKETKSEESVMIITDISGRTIYSQQIKKGQQNTILNISEFSSGIYFVKLKLGSEVSVKKLVVE